MESRELRLELNVSESSVWDLTYPAFFPSPPEKLRTQRMPVWIFYVSAFLGFNPIYGPNGHPRFIDSTMIASSDALTVRRDSTTPSWQSDLELHL
jgi:hypothetical protein